MSTHNWLGLKDKVEMAAISYGNAYLIQRIIDVGTKKLEKRFLIDHSDDYTKISMEEFVKENLKNTNYKKIITVLHELAFTFDGVTKSQLDMAMDCLPSYKEVSKAKHATARNNLLDNVGKGLPQLFLTEKTIYTTRGDVSKAALDSIYSMLEMTGMITREKYLSSPTALIVQITDEFMKAITDSNEARRKFVRLKMDSNNLEFIANKRQSGRARPGFLGAVFATALLATTLLFTPNISFASDIASNVAPFTTAIELKSADLGSEAAELERLLFGETTLTDKLKGGEAKPPQKPSSQGWFLSDYSAGALWNAVPQASDVELEVADLGSEAAELERLLFGETTLTDKLKGGEAKPSQKPSSQGWFLSDYSAGALWNAIPQVSATDFVVADLKLGSGNQWNRNL